MLLYKELSSPKLLSKEDIMRVILFLLALFFLVGITGCAQSVPVVTKSRISTMDKSERNYIAEVYGYCNPEIPDLLEEASYSRFSTSYTTSDKNRDLYIESLIKRCDENFFIRI